MIETLFIIKTINLLIVEQKNVHISKNLETFLFRIHKPLIYCRKKKGFRKHIVISEHIH